MNGNIEERTMKIYHVETKEDYDALMIELEENGCEWNSGAKPRNYNGFKRYGKDTYIYDEYGVISLSSGEYFKKYRSDETLVEYKTKGENMTQEEMKRKLQKNAFDVYVAVKSFARGISEAESDLKEAKTSAKKLIEKIDEYLESQKPKFKKGNIVASQVFDDGSFSLVRLNKDLTNHLTPVDGLWYTKRDCDITDMSLGVFKEDTRHATPEEIAEYEVALNFHKHGRKLFEVEQGDIISDRESNKLFVDVPSIWNKKDFTSLNYTFLKTAVEVNEWLGADDE